MTTIALDSRKLAVEMHGLLDDIDSAELPDQARELHDRLQCLMASMNALLEASDARVRRHVAELRDVALRYAPRDGSSTWEATRRWQDFAARLRPALARWLHTLRTEGISLPSGAARLAAPDAEVVRSRPGNLIRNAFHVTNALVVIGLAEFVLVTDELRIGAAGLGMLAAWGMEAARRLSPAINRQLMRLFARVAHPHETTEVNSATWYATALLLLAAFVPLDIAVIALAVLGLGDPAAAIVGRRFGRIRIGESRTLEGSVAFVAAGGLAAFVVTAWLHPAPWAVLALRALVGATLGAFAEALTRRLDDNLTIPLSVGVGLGVLRLWGL